MMTNPDLVSLRYRTEVLSYSLFTSLVPPQASLERNYKTFIVTLLAVSYYKLFAGYIYFGNVSIYLFLVYFLAFFPSYRAL